METVDYIVIGAGSAGCIVGERLSADLHTTVLVLEAGEDDNSLWIHVPLGYSKLNSDLKRTWQFVTEPDEGLCGRTVTWPRGRVLGGSGSVNAMVYCRGLPDDYQDWEQSGAKGWGWTNVKRTFEELETKVAPTGVKSGSGSIHVQNVEDRIHRVNRHFFAAIEELNLPLTDDFNGENPEGAGAYHINTKNSRRCSSAVAFLRPAMSRPNLTVRTKTHVKRILFQDADAMGVELGNGEKIQARREIILSAGAIASPQLLQVSGIGPGKLLERMGIPIVYANDNVGGHLQDHLAANFTFKARETTLNAMLRPLYGQALAALQYVLTRKGPLSLSVNQCGGFLRSNPALYRPDQQLYFNPISYRIVPCRNTIRRVIDPFNGFIICAQPTRPTSRGRIDIQSKDIAKAPLIRPNSLSTEEDRQTVIAGGRLCQKIMASNALSTIVETSVAPHLPHLDDKAILEDFQARASTVFHPVSTCRMGAAPDTSVTDCRLKVHGVNRLRVVDASAFPNITSGNTNAPTMMLALKGAGLILEDRRRAAQ